MRPLFWSKIPAARLAGTVWTDLDDTGIELHEDELVELFARPDKKEKAKSPSASATKSSKPAKVVSLLSGKRQQNAGIALSSIRVEPSVVEDWLTRCSTKLTAPVLRTLLKLVPTKDEVQALNEHDKSTPESIKQIPPVDAFMLMLGDIPRVKQRIECLLALIVAPAQAMSAMSPNGVDLVNEHQTWRALPRLFKHISDTTGADADEHFHEIRAADAEEVGVCFTRNGFGYKCFSSSG